MAGIAWVNGRLVPPEEGAISVLDRGFMYGEGLFETMRAYGGRVFRLEQHLDRLLSGAAEIGLAAQGREAMAHAVAEALEASGLADASVRLTVTPPRGGGDAKTSPPYRGTLVVLVRPLSLPPQERYEHGCTAVAVPAAVMGGSVLRRIKSLNYLDKILAQRAAERAGAHEAILVDPDGCVVEGAMRNVFAVVRGELVTPPLSRGLLPGITRAAVLEVADQQEIAGAERDATLAELMAAKECFLTSSLAEILPVASVDGQALPAPVPGTITQKLAEGYRRLVAEELGLGGAEKRVG